MKLLFVTIVFCSFSICLGDVDTDTHPSRELNVTQLDYYVNSEEGRTLLENEFMSIKAGKRRPWTYAESDENLLKNRYSDLLAFDDTRVELVRSYDPESNYINANYIDGYHGKKEYVATQGPLPNTTRDLWAMVWQLNVKKIVMLANLTEHGESKVAKYWPEATAAYGDITVTKLAEVPHPQLNHVIRIFSLSKTGIALPRIIRQFHYIGWPDFGVPSDRLSVVALMQQVRKYRPDHKAPIVIHCSAGVGRTGTVILLDSMIEKAKTEGMVDFPKRLDHMRTQRVDVVEKKEQYIFAHQAVYEMFNKPEAEHYLMKVENEYRKSDYESFTDQFKEPGDLAEAIRQMKWHSTGLQILIGAIENGYNKTRK